MERSKFELNGFLSRYLTPITACVTTLFLLQISLPISGTAQMQLPMAAVAVAALVSGPWPALFVLVASALFMMFYALEPVGSFQVSALGDQVRLFFFAFFGIGLIWISHFFTDIRKRAIDSETRYTDLVEHLSGSFVWEYDIVAKKLLYISNGFEKLLGYPASEWIGTDIERWRQRIPEDDFIALGNLISVAHIPNLERVCMHRLLARDGSELWFQTSVYGRKYSNRNLVFGLSVDITEQRSTQERLVNQQLQLQGLFEHSPFSIYIKDLRGRYLVMSRHSIANIGIPSSRFIGRTDFELFPADTAALLRKEDQDVAAGRGPLEFEERIFSAAENRYRDFMTIKFPLLTKERVPYAVCGISTDITERKRAERDLKKSETRFRAIFDLAASGMAQINPSNHRFISVNDKFCEITGYEREELLRIGPADLLFSEDRSMSISEALQSKEQRFAIEHRRESETSISRYRCKDGRIIWTESMTNIIRDPNENTECIIAIVNDISERRLAEAFTIDQGEALKLVAEGGALESVLTRLASALEAQSPRLRTSFSILEPASNTLKLVTAPSLSFPQSDTIKTIPIGPCAGPSAAAVFNRHPVLVENAQENPICENLRAFATTLNLKSCWSYPLFSSTDHVIGVLTLYSMDTGLPSERESRIIETTTDIAGIAIEHQQNLEDLRAARFAAESANEAKTHFLANMSHEIRTPIGVIQGFAELLLDTDRLSEEQIQWIRTIERNTRMLTDIIDEILDLSKIEAGRMNIERIDFDLGDVLRDIRALMEFKARQKEIQFILHRLGPVPQVIHSDPTRLRQVLINVIGNAIKFTAKGRVTVEVAYHGPPTGKGTLLFTITDTGIGIAHEAQARIFQPFGQADSSTTRRYGGTGLGLYIAKRMAQAMDASLSLAHSEPDKGSTFVLSLEIDMSAVNTTDVNTADVNTTDVNGSAANPPVISKPAGEQPTLATAELNGTRVLLVDDSADNRMMLDRVLSRVGAKVDEAENGDDGVKKALSREYDIILMDIQMPILDGFEATARLRNHHYRKPIVALTAHAMNEEREKALRSGFDGYITKPIDRSLMVSTIKQILLH